MRIKMQAKFVIASVGAVLFLSALPCHAQADWKVLKSFQIGGQGSWDYFTVDSSTHRLFVPRSTHTMVIDAESGKTLGDIPGQKGAHGVAIVPSLNRGFISDGGGQGAVVVFDLKTYAVIGTIAAQPDTDGIIFDQSSGQVLFVSGDGGTLMTLKPDITANGKIDEPIALGGKPEFLASDGAGKIYVNLVDKNEVAVVDIKARKVIARWPVAPGGSPVGMTIDTKKHRLFIGCRKPQKLIVMSTEDGKVLADMDIGAGVDATKMDNGQAFASCRDGSLAVISETSPGKFALAQTVKTGAGAGTMGVDSSTHKIYLPTADYEEVKPGATGRPKMIPGSFKILVVGRASD
jgi:hypothetical protein